MSKIQKAANSKIIQAGLFIMFGLVLLPRNLKSIGILVFGLTFLATAISRRKFVFDLKYFLLNGAFFIAIVASLTYSEDLDYAMRKLQQFSALIVFPFIFALTTQEERKKLYDRLPEYLWVYIISVFLFNVLAFVWFLTTRFPFQELLIHFHTLLRVESGKFNIHPIYLSMHCGVAILFSLFLLRKNKNKLQIAALLFIDIVLVSFLLLYAKKGPLIALVIVLTLFMLFQQSKRFVKPYLISILTFIVLIVTIPTTREKFVELLKIEPIATGGATSTNIRYTIYESAQELISESPIIGYGLGDYKSVLINRFTSKGEDVLIQGKYNAHNQLFSFLLIGGVITLLLFLFSMGINLLYAVRFDNQILILLLVFYGIVMLTENILEREHGVIFFSFFINFFTLKSLFVREQAI